MLHTHTLQLISSPMQTITRYFSTNGLHRVYPISCLSPGITDQLLYIYQ